MDFNGPARPLGTADVRTIAGYLGCHIAAVRAVLAVEAAGKGFDRHGRPKMLFEPHIFWRELGVGAKRDRAAREGLAYAKWKSGSYPSDSYPRLLKATAIDETAALRSASWGLGQVMGFNHKAAGFGAVQEMVRAMTVGEGAQLYAMARFIVSKGLQHDLRKLRWSGFAKGYNGSGYAQHGYHTRLKAAYDRRPASEKVTPPPATEAQLAAMLDAGTAPLPQPKLVPPVMPATYTVRSGDTLSAIAQRFGVDLHELAAINGIRDLDVIRVGDVLRIPPQKPAQPPPPVPAPSPAPVSSRPPAVTPEPARGGFWAWLFRLFGGWG